MIKERSFNALSSSSLSSAFLASQPASPSPNAFFYLYSIEEMGNQSIHYRPRFLLRGKDKLSN